MTRSAASSGDRRVEWRQLVPLLLIGASVALPLGFVAAALLAASDALPFRVAGALTAQTPNRASSGGIEFVIVCGPPTGAGLGFGFGFLILFFGGVPAAILAKGLAAVGRNRQRPWTTIWGNIFMSGFVFQLGNLILTAGLLVALTFAESGIGTDGMVLIQVTLLSSVGCSIWGLRTWRALQGDVGAPHTGVIARTV